MASPPRRSPDAQLRAMKQLWPDFLGRKLGNGTLLWSGFVRPKAQAHRLLVYWHPKQMPLPYVFIDEPALRPRDNGSFEDIPHLIFDSERPEQSALCLFDLDGREWSPADLIAETTIFWASEWLLYYELWHMSGVWEGPGVGYENVAEMRVAEARRIRESGQDVH